MTKEELLKDNAFLRKTVSELLTSLESRTFHIGVLCNHIDALTDILAGNAPQQVSSGRTWLCYDDGSEIVPNSNHYALHRRREQEPCKRSIREASAYHHIKREERRKKREREAKYNCEPHEAFTPNHGHIERHKRREETPCEQSYKEYAAYAYLKRNGTLDGWKYYTNKKNRRKRKE